MTHNLKKGQLRLEGAEPMSFVESDDATSARDGYRHQRCAGELTSEIGRVLRASCAGGFMAEGRLCLGWWLGEKRKPHCCDE